MTAAAPVGAAGAITPAEPAAAVAAVAPPATAATIGAVEAVELKAAGEAAAGWRCRWRADRGDAGGRLDRAVVRHFAGVPGLSRSQVQGWIGAGRVRVNGAAALRPAGRLAMGDELQVELPAPPPSRGRTRPLAAQRLPLAILYEDEHLLALDKPAGLVVHPTGRYRDGTLANALAWYLGEGAPAAAGGQAGALPTAGRAASGQPEVRVGL
ncbi:MAG TPA: S4 domain-containing protein, partial [Thermoanaerobaculia bacterium]|nr:S4 domain-containing protein [Thermoanaerobaculia bacterium]